MSEVLCYNCYRPIELGAVLGHDHLHCSFECAAETGRRAWKSVQVLASKPAAISVNPVRSKVPAPPIEANA